MGAVYFYHMTGSPLSATLPVLLRKSLGAGWRVLVRAPGREAQARIDDLLWTYDAASFLPHGVEDGPSQAVLIGGAEEALGARQAVISVMGAEVSAEEAEAAERGMILFDGHDDEAVAHARVQWRSLTGAGVAAQYWSDAEGGWQKKAEAGGGD